ncbi:MAG: DegT/DnrJ/EryC1/StrS aminotransferase family protein [Microcoleus sp. PH2017_29_MFU_D_A]|jgi:dTDP-4-amino-4,6-dideoxygalactose transaminase|uniref:DegT/DnrJ/EryC1/StrS family aminotransferase n=1 Tax=unclassified Microcoleus TaxID=2642155 RepID=UPI001D1A7A7B|nr:MULTISPECIES: DegT/DnrJ/EryC1/StrS aminotransferase family protein [unclassified Microcoleus]MCC3416709.1 DegT/DnrJ/EryC1/StrS aminotransferase family protein [Microcoleus sp. PH2017_07_MST_O_A]MCC3433696.1 DegT/DnrJ/EryC1/StrS aminotransferase family protein [Microcoleus sp. PH2017_04_SCI_O_A]MCC3441051.1 DegT/DnrJ/EryC1/StrS aminotransferase family protein [Microcoleus sp. PH2017_03_ELD_O_A]MCC3465723.1 DegT/DnrJ/EryC1/StrS aminotransferase family protein [Microcoleus sp. PH2017_06_SFM_O_A
MSSRQPKVPFVNLYLQHQPIESQIAATLATIIQHGDFILGEALAEFETAFAAASGVKYGVGVACGTDAIALGLQACGIHPGDEIILPANTFIATIIGVIQAKAVPILVDCDPETALIDLTAAETAVSSKTKAIIPVHLYGQMVSPREVLDFASRHKLMIFEDAAQAHLAEREGYRAGSFGKAAAFSFYPSKNLGCFGDGGMLITNDAEIAQKMRTLRNYGAPSKYLHAEIGTNSRLDNLQAAVLNLKLPYLEKWNRDRTDAAQYYNTLLEPLKPKGIVPIANHSGTGHIYHLYVIQITDKSPLRKPSPTGATPTKRIARNTLQEHLTREGIQTGIHYPVPCHLQPAYQNLGNPGDFPHTETLCEQILSLPMYPGLSNTQIEQVVRAIEKSVDS